MNAKTSKDKIKAADRSATVIADTAASYAAGKQYTETGVACPEVYAAIYAATYATEFAARTK